MFHRLYRDRTYGCCSQSMGPLVYFESEGFSRDRRDGDDLVYYVPTSGDVVFSNRSRSRPYYAVSRASRSRTVSYSRSASEDAL